MLPSASADTQDEVSSNLTHCEAKHPCVTKEPRGTLALQQLELTYTLFLLKH
jgi:hypothetical protein